MGKELGGRISELLKETGLTQKALAQRIGVTEAVISRYVSGEREPKPDVLANMATALHTTSDYLLGIETDEYSHSRIRRMIARNASSMTEQEKKELINALFGEE
ncbi:MAG: helix-turn-helix transcriptional regulator [Clostridia bacterium]|nr:helix-turn-helix transcriptional regulator [Clostridia bacterium]